MRLGLRRRARKAIATSIMAVACTPLALAQVALHPLCADRAPQTKDEPSSQTGVCRIVDVRKPAGMDQPVAERDAAAFLAGAAAEADVVILGEVHDNPLHHRLRGTVIERVAKARETAGKPKPAVVLEHIRTDQQAALDRFAELHRDAEGRGTADDLLGFLDWDQTGWPDKSMFVPLFQSILGVQLPVLPGDAPREEIKTIARSGSGALDPDRRARLKLANPLPAPLAGALASELKDSHCGLIPDSAIGPMSAAQRFRDAHLADAAVAAAREHGTAVLLTGNGHVRADRAVPYYVRQMTPDRTLLTVMFLEVEAGKTKAADYLPRSPEGVPAADIIVLTARAEREDPCEGLRARMARPKGRDKPAESPTQATEKPAGARPVP